MNCALAAPFLKTKKPPLATTKEGSKTKTPMGQIYDGSANPAIESEKLPKTKRRYDLTFEWHLYAQLREDYNKVFTRYHKRALWYEGELGKEEIFDDPIKAKKFQENLFNITWEIKVLAATYDYLKHIYEYALEAHGALSEAYLEQKLRADLEEERADLEKERADKNFRGWSDALKHEAQATNTIIESFTNIISLAHGN
jgi:hypothetical protein